MLCLLITILLLSVAALVTATIRDTLEAHERGPPVRESTRVPGGADYKGSV